MRGDLDDAEGGDVFDMAVRECMEVSTDLET